MDALRFLRITFLPALIAAGLLFPPVAQAAAIQHGRIPSAGQDPRWDIIRRSTEFLSNTVKAAGSQPDGGVPMQNLYDAYLFCGRALDQGKLDMAGVIEINRILRQNGAEGNHVHDRGGGQLRRQDVGWWANGQRVLNFPDWRTLPDKARYLDNLLNSVSTQKLDRRTVVTLAADAHIVIGKQQLFSDGNHRTARLVADWILMRQGYPPASYDQMPKKEYELEHRTSQKGARELMTTYMGRAVAASEKLLPATVAPGTPPARQATQPPRIFGQSDWRSDTPIIDSLAREGQPTVRLPVQQTMRLAIGRACNYVLHDSGHLYFADQGSLQRQQGVPPFVAIDSLDGVLIALTADGSLMMVERGVGQIIMSDRALLSFCISPNRRLYAIAADGNILEYDGQKWRSLEILEGAWQLAVDEHGLLCALRNDGNIFRRTKKGWVQVDNGTGTKQIDMAHQQLWVMKNDGKLFHSTDLLKPVDYFKVADPDPTRQFCLNGTDVYDLKMDGALWKIAGDGKWSELAEFRGAQLIALRARDGRVIGLSNAGKIVNITTSAPRETLRKENFQRMHVH